MRAHHRFLLSAFAVLLAVGSAPAEEQKDPRLEPPFDPPIKQTYAGPGQVVMLDYGSVLVQLGTEKDWYETIILTDQKSRAMKTLASQRALGAPNDEAREDALV